MKEEFGQKIDMDKNECRLITTKYNDSQKCRLLNSTFSYIEQCKKSQDILKKQMNET